MALLALFGRQTFSSFSSSIAFDFLFLLNVRFPSNSMLKLPAVICHRQLCLTGGFFASSTGHACI